MNWQSKQRVKRGLLQFNFSQVLYLSCPLYEKEYTFECLYIHVGVYNSQLITNGSVFFSLVLCWEALGSNVWIYYSKS